MLPDRVSNRGPLTYESGALPIALRGPARESIYLSISLSIPPSVSLVTLVLDIIIVCLFFGGKKYTSTATGLENLSIYLSAPPSVRL